MASNKIYTFMASQELWTKENRVCKIEDIGKAPFYEELVFEIKSRADIEAFIEAKEKKYKQDDLKINMKGQEKANEVALKKIERLETRLNTIETIEKHINHVYNNFSALFSYYSQKKKETFLSLMSGYAQTGMFSMFYLPKLMAEPRGLFVSGSSKKKSQLANKMLKELMDFCKQHDIFNEVNLDSSGATKTFFEELCSGKTTLIATYSADIEKQKNMVLGGIESVQNEIKKAEHSIKLANDGFERDNYVLIDLENSIIRQYAKNMTAKLFPEEPKPESKPEPKVKSQPVELAEPTVSPELQKEETKTSKLSDMLGKIKKPDWNNLKEKSLDKLKLVKNPFKK